MVTTKDGGREKHRPGTVQLGIVGAGTAGGNLPALAQKVGALAAERGWTVICGGMGGVMAAVSEGVAEAGGIVVGILPGSSRKEGNPHLTVALPTNMGHGRNAIIAQSADVLIAVGGGYGTLSEIALGLKMGKPVISLESWCPDSNVTRAESAEEAVEAAARSLGLES
ncbi:TIGR00725 family protein [Candidatus Moduliflexota bacterium]